MTIDTAAIREKVEDIRFSLEDIRDRLEDEGDRVYFGSTNDADQFREIVGEIEDAMWSRLLARDSAYMSDLLQQIDSFRAENNNLSAENLTLAVQNRALHAELAAKDALLAEHDNNVALAYVVTELTDKSCPPKLPGASWRQVLEVANRILTAPENRWQRALQENAFSCAVILAKLKEQEL